MLLTQLLECTECKGGTDLVQRALCEAFPKEVATCEKCSILPWLGLPTELVKGIGGAIFERACIQQGGDVVASEGEDAGAAPSQIAELVAGRGARLPAWLCVDDIRLSARLGEPVDVLAIVDPSWPDKHSQAVGISCLEIAICEAGVAVSRGSIEGDREDGLSSLKVERTKCLTLLESQAATTIRSPGKVR